MKNRFMRVNEVAEALEVSVPYAYKIIRKLNEELESEGYLIDRALQRDVKVQGNPRVYKALRNELTSLCDELKRVETVGQVNDDFLSVMNMALTILSCMNEVSK